MLTGTIAACSVSEEKTPPTTTEQISKSVFAGRTLEVFAGVVSRPPTEDAAREFEKATGARVLLYFGGSGVMLSQMKLARRGDLYFPASSDFMEMAKREKLVLPETERIIIYLIPVISVTKGNPQNVHFLADLARPGLRVGIARPDTVAVGLYAAETLDQAGLGVVKRNIVAVAENAEKLASLLSLGAIDVALGWNVFSSWDPEHIDTVWLEPAQVPRIAYASIAITPLSRDRELAQAFIDFLSSQKGEETFQSRNYLVSVEQARQHAAADTPVGGEWVLPEEWK